MNGTDSLIGIAYQRHLLVAILDPSNYQLTIFKSVLVSGSESWYGPVRFLLSHNCAACQYVAEWDDERFLFGRRREVVYELFPDCPAGTVSHQCVKESDSVRREFNG